MFCSRVHFNVYGNTALLWQKEASDKSLKSDKEMFLDLT